MRKNYSNGFTICIAGIFLLNAFNTAALIAGGDPLLAFNCLDDGQCENFKNETMNASCGANAQCQCTLLATHEPTDCIANEVKVTNIISGPCPCTQSHSVCHEEQQICFCADKYVPSSDLRRCLHRERNLDETCEMDSQCRDANEFAVCDRDSKLCKCQENHAIINGTCVPLAENIKCQNNESCKLKDSNLICSLAKLCVCHTGYVFALAKNSTNASCLPTLQYHDTCLSDVQCQHTLGWGAECNHQDICECKTKHFLRNPEGPLNLTKQLCKPMINFGQYCSDENDCYQPYLADQAQTMHCSYASCMCRYGFLNEKLFICNPPISDASGLWKIYSQLYSIIFLFFILLL